MGFLVFPLLLVLTIAPVPGPPAHALADFSRFSSAIDREIAIVDVDGTVREGTVTAVTAEDVTLRFGSGAKTFPRADVMSAERIRDRRVDGAVKGAIFGAILGLLTMQAYESTGERFGAWAGSTAIYGGIGYLLDAAQMHREPLYRAPASAAPATTASLKLSLRF
jgi:hypothetical protein